MNIKDVWTLTKESFSAWSNDYAPSMGAAISYYTLFSIAPLLIIVISVAGLLFGADAVRSGVFDQLHALMGEEGAEAVEEMVTHASEPTTGGIATIISVIGLAIGATTVFGEIQNDLDRIWRAPAADQGSGIWHLLRTRLLSFGMILGIAFLLAVSLVLSAVIATLGKWWSGWLGGWETLAHVLDIVVNIGLLTLIFALVYKMIPRVEIAWHDVWVGAVVTALLFTIGKVAIGLYLGKSDVTSSFGSAGSFAVLMIWVYYAAQIFLLGAEFTRVYAERFGSRRGVTKERRSNHSRGGRRQSDRGLAGQPSAA
jgi:membrane protein